MNSRLYNAVWRWHFYAGVFCIPFVIWLSCTGSIYLWRPQIQAWLDRPYNNLPVDGQRASPDAQVAAALKAVPGSQLHKYQLPEAPSQAVQILVGKAGAGDTRVYVDPHSLAVLKTEDEQGRLFNVIFHLHGELLAGAIGSYLVEVAACWTIVMLLTGLYLWWPRDGRGLGGVLYPRLGRNGRGFWRDIHATAGFWASIFALGLILTGLPWAKGWGTYLTEIRQLTGTSRGPVDWTIGGKPPPNDAMMMEHASHTVSKVPYKTAHPVQPGELERVITTTRPLALAAPVSIKPPVNADDLWLVASEAADRPLRADVKIDGATGRVIERTNFADRHWIDRVIGYGIAVHEGQLFGLANQILGSLTALFLVTLSVSGAVMWWKRRPAGTLGAPMALDRPKIGTALIIFILLLAIYMPVFGLTLALVCLVETLIFRRIESLRLWLGLRAERA
jgi:uncharacterized iron-regulated membrane protein